MVEGLINNRRANQNIIIYINAVPDNENRRVNPNAEEDYEADQYEENKERQSPTEATIKLPKKAKKIK